MRIAFVVGDISSSGGIERVTSILSKVLVSREYHITIISLFKAHEHLQYKFLENIDIQYLSNKKYAIKKAGGFSRLWMFINILFKLRSSIKNLPVDILIGQGFPVNFILWLTGFRKKLIACEHVNYNYYSDFIQRIRIRIYKSCLHVVTLTKDDTDNYKIFLNNVSLIPNPVELSTKKVSDLSSTQIISVGRLETAKGFDMLLHASKEVFQKYPNWTLNIFGSGILEEKLLNLKNELGLQENVFFRGTTKNIEKEYLSSSLYVLSSRYEGFGMVLVEAASCGLPIIAFDCPTGPKDILIDDNGVLVPPNDIVSLTNAMIDMIDNKEKREFYASKGQSIAKRYLPENICDQWENLFSRLKNLKDKS